MKCNWSVGVSAVLLLSLLVGSGANVVSSRPQTQVEDYQVVGQFDGDTEVHVAGLKPDWNATTATWLQAKSGSSWQLAGAKGANDRTAPVDSKLVNYTEVGSWLSFDVTTLVQAGTTSFILYGEHLGVNKAIYFPSNDYWDASKRPLLTIRHD